MIDRVEIGGEAGGEKGGGRGRHRKTVDHTAVQW
jgi:hypothetical protein